MTEAERIERLATELAPPGTALVAIGDRTWSTGDRATRYPIYSVTKAVIAAAVLRLAGRRELSLDDPAPDGWPGTVRQLLDHTSGARDYGALRSHDDAVRETPLDPWSDEAFLARAREAGPTFAPGAGWAYSNTGYLLLRRLLDEHGGLERWVRELDLRTATVADVPGDFRDAPPGPSELVGEGVDDVRGRYHPHWVGHRTLVASVGDLLGFWQSLPPAMLDPTTFVPIGREVPGFGRASYGLGVMADPASPLGVMVGHGGGGPGYAAGVFAVPARRAVAIVLTNDERFDAQGTARRLLGAALDAG